MLGIWQSGNLRTSSLQREPNSSSQAFLGGTAALTTLCALDLTPPGPHRAPPQRALRLPHCHICPTATSVQQQAPAPPEDPQDSDSSAPAAASHAQGTQTHSPRVVQEQPACGRRRQSLALRADKSTLPFTSQNRPQPSQTDRHCRCPADA